MRHEWWSWHRSRSCAYPLLSKVYMRNYAVHFRWVWYRVASLPSSVNYVTLLLQTIMSWTNTWKHTPHSTRTQRWLLLQLESHWHRTTLYYNQWNLSSITVHTAQNKASSKSSLLCQHLSSTWHTCTREKVTLTHGFLSLDFQRNVCIFMVAWFLSCNRRGG